MKITRLRRLMGEDNWAIYQSLRKRLKVEKYLERSGDSVVNWRKRAKLKLIAYKGGKCEICGYNKDVPNAYDFHHKNRDEKEFGIGSGDAKSYESMKKEADKCLLLCRNCHAEVHAEEYRKSEIETLKRKTEKIDILQKEIDTFLNQFVSQFKIEKPPKKTKINCIVCNNQIINNMTKKCRTCYRAEMNLKNKKTNLLKPPKETLKQEIKEMSWSALGRKYNVSDNAVKKWAKNYDIKFTTTKYNKQSNL